MYVSLSWILPQLKSQIYCRSNGFEKKIRFRKSSCFGSEARERTILFPYLTPHFKVSILLCYACSSLYLTVIIQNSKSHLNLYLELLSKWQIFGLFASLTFFFLQYLAWWTVLENFQLICVILVDSNEDTSLLWILEVFLGKQHGRTHCLLFYHLSIFSYN